MTTHTEDLLKQVTASIEKASSDFSKKAEDALKEARNAGSLSAETKAAVDKMATEYNSLTQAQAKLQAQLGEVEQAFAAIPQQQTQQRPQSAGQIAVANESLKAFAASIEGGKRLNVPVPRAALLSSDVAEGVVEPMRLPGIDAMPKQRLFIEDLIASGRTTSPAIFWVQMTGFTNNASVVGENPTGGKPYSDIEFATKITPVQTIAHMFKASKQILDDFAQLQSTIDVEMRFGLRYVKEQEILFGDGTGNHLHGIVPQATAYDPAFTVDNHTPIDDLRLAMLQAQLARLPATGHVLHFTDWAKIETQKDTLGRYIVGNPLSLAGPTLWGLPVVATEAAGFEGKFLTGSFQYGAQLFDREDANVVISTENADDFEKNMVSIRAELRTALAVKRPEAFIYGSFTTPTTP